MEIAFIDVEEAEASPANAPFLLPREGVLG